jgi:hypothetical protein
MNLSVIQILAGCRRAVYNMESMHVSLDALVPLHHLEIYLDLVEIRQRTKKKCQLFVFIKIDDDQ